MSSGNKTKTSRDGQHASGPRYSSADRHKAIVQTLCAHPSGMTRHEIYQALIDKGLPLRTDRTVLSDLQHLAADAHNLEVERVGKANRYRWVGKRPAWAAGIDDRERVLLMLAQEHLSDLLPKEVNELIRSKLDDPSSAARAAALPKPLLNWPDKVAALPLLPRLVAPKVSPDVLSSISTALLHDKVLNVTYRNLQGRTLADKPVLPLALVQQAERLFLVCRFRGHEDTRHLAVHRIKEAVLTPHGFERPDFSLQDYLEQGAFGFGNGERITLKVKVRPHLAELLKETPLSDDQKICALEDGTSLVSATVIRGEQIRWWIRMHGSAIKVVEPEGLLDEVDSTLPAKTPS